MTSILFEKIFGNFLGEVTDYELARLEQYEAMEVMQELLHKALAESSLRRVFSLLKIDDDNQIITFEMKHSVDVDSDEEFVTTAIVRFMAYEWWHKRVNNVALAAQLIGGAEQKFYSQSNHLTELRASRDDALTKAKDFIMEHNAMFNAHLNGGV